MTARESDEMTIMISMTYMPEAFYNSVYES